MNDRLYRSVDDRVIAGVCGGLAVRMGVDPSLVRIGYAIVTLLSGIFPLLVLYVVMAAVVPEEPTGFAGVGRYPAPPGPDSIPGWTPPGAGPGLEWASGPQPADSGSVPPTGAGADASGATPGAPAAGTPAAGAPAPASSSWQAPPTWQSPPTSREQRRLARQERRERREGDAVPAVIGGLVLVALGTWFLVRDRLAIDWGVVWAAGLVALGVVVVVAAFRPRR